MLFGVFEVGHLSACQCEIPNPYASSALVFLTKYGIPTVLVSCIAFGALLQKLGAMNRIALGLCVALSAGLVGWLVPPSAVPASIFTKHLVADLALAGFLVGAVAHRFAFFRTQESWKKGPTFDDPDLGKLTYSDEQWSSELIQSMGGDVQLNLHGDSSQPAAPALAEAKRILANPSPVLDRAKAFIKANPQAQELMARGEGGVLTLDGYSFSSVAGSYRVEFGLSKQPDVAIDVEFVQDEPREVSFGD